MPKRKKIILTAASSLVVVLLFTAFVLPRIIRSKAVEALQQATGRTVRIESIHINPLTLTVGADGFAMEEKGGGPFIKIGSLRASLGLASIYRRALIISSVEITSPSFSFSRLAPNKYSFSDILDRQKSEPKQKQDAESHFSINNISITNGYVDFFDQAVANGRKHTVRKLEIQIPFVSNIPYLVEKYIDPKLSAEINGAPFNFNGKLKPLSKSLETSVRIDLKQLNLPELAAYSPQRLPADLKSGKLSIDADVNYRISAHKQPELMIKGLVRLSDLAVDMPDGRPLAKLPELTVKAGKLEVFAKSFEFESVNLERMELFVSRDAQGRWTHDQLVPQGKATRKEAAAGAKKSTQNDTKKAADGPKVVVSSLLLTDCSLHLSDAVPKGGFKGSITRIDLKLNDFNNGPDKNALYQLSMLIDEAAFKSDGQFSVNPLSARTKVDLSGLRLQRGWPYMSSFITAPVKGELDISSDIAFTKEGGLSTENGKLALRDLSTRFGKKDGFDLALLSINGAAFSQKENSLSINELNVSKGSLAMSREHDGKLSPLSLLVSKPAAGPAAASAGPVKGAAPKSGAKSQPPLKYSLKQFKLDRFNLAFTDRSREEAPTFRLRNTAVTLTNFNGPRFTPAQLRFASTFGRNSPLKANGMITPVPFRYKGDLSIGRLPLADFEAYFPDNLNVELISGNLDTRLKLDVAIKDGKPSGSFSGSSGVRAFHSIDSDSEEDLLKWESLQFDNFKGSLEPFSLNIGQIALNNFYSRIIVNKNGTLNLQNLMEKPGTGDQGPGIGDKGKEKPVAVAVQQKTDGPVQAGRNVSQQKVAAKDPIKIGAITIQGGTLNFTDNHMPQHFTTTFFNLGGRVSGLSSDEAQMADVDLRGNLENHSPLQITGRINPLREDLFVDLKVAFKDIELSPVTPYTGTFLGYTVEKGKLFLDLKYHIEKKELNSENKIFVDQFTFGSRVESEKATSLPVKLGLALLKDRKGEIHLDVPVTGRTDDPKFSIWRLVGQVLKNLLVKAATSPFSLLSSMFGGGEDLSNIQFANGAGYLNPQEEQKLNALSRALADRPALKLELKAYVDREKDGEGYRAILLEKKIRTEKYLAVSKGQQGAAGLDAVKVLPEEYSRYLKAVYKKEKFPKPRNMIGLVKDLPDSEMKKLIITNTVVGSNELRALAMERNSTVMNYLVNRGKVESNRIFQKVDDIFKKPAKEGAPASRVELNAIVQ